MRCTFECVVIQVKCFTLARADVPELTLDDKCIGLEVRVKQCDETFELILDDLQSAINQNLANVDRSLAQFLEILTSQEAFFSEYATSLPLSPLLPVAFTWPTARANPTS